MSNSPTDSSFHPPKFFTLSSTCTVKLGNDGALAQIQGKGELSDLVFTPDGTPPEHTLPYSATILYGNKSDISNDTKFVSRADNNKMDIFVGSNIDDTAIMVVVNNTNFSHISQAGSGKWTSL
ncbi:hypothetical protein RhiJN_23310 [Ceratobasidium sp. AG-Ba]|nr:hypothetical protein RhiJN_23310 [Ceratobasidium sp. AG-Ba]